MLSRSRSRPAHARHDPFPPASAAPSATGRSRPRAGEPARGPRACRRPRTRSLSGNARQRPGTRDWRCRRQARAEGAPPPFEPMAPDGSGRGLQPAPSPRGRETRPPSPSAPAFRGAIRKHPGRTPSCRGGVSRQRRKTRPEPGETMSRVYQECGDHDKSIKNVKIDGRIINILEIMAGISRMLRPYRGDRRWARRRFGRCRPRSPPPQH